MTRVQLLVLLDSFGAIIKSAMTYLSQNGGSCVLAYIGVAWLKFGCDDLFISIDSSEDTMALALERPVPKIRRIAELKMIISQSCRQNEIGEEKKLP